MNETTATGADHRPTDHLLTDHRPTDHLLTDHHLGDVPAQTGDGRDTTAHLGRVSVTGGFDLPGEFDLPPEEPVRLVGDVPWELRED